MRKEKIKELISQAIDKNYSSGLPVVKSPSPTVLDGRDDDEGFFKRFLPSLEKKTHQKGHEQRVKIEEETKTEAYRSESEAIKAMAEIRKDTLIKDFAMKAQGFLDRQEKNNLADKEIDGFCDFYKRVERIDDLEVDGDDKKFLVRRVHSIYFPEDGKKK